MAKTHAVIQTGVPGFDVLLGGGIPQRKSLLITGQPGSGKTVLASQVAMHHAAGGMPVLLASTTSESQDKILADLEGFSFFDRSRLGEELFFLSIYPWLKKGAREAKDVLISTLRERKAKLLVVDGLRSLRDLWDDEAKLREFFYELSVSLAAIDCTGIFITEYPLDRLIDFAESTTIDGVVSLTFEQTPLTRSRRVEVVKLRGMKHLLGKHLMAIRDEGIEIVPRLESITPVDSEYEPSTERAVFGLPELDALFHGGVPVHSAALLAGSSGIGKTLIGLHFAAAGAAVGEKGLVISFGEPPKSLIARARRVGLDLAPCVEDGTVVLHYDPSFEVEADQIVRGMLEMIDRTGATRLLVDDVDVIERSLDSPERAQAFFKALMIQLRRRGVTSLFTRKISKLVGPELDFGDTALAALAENLFFARYVELRGRLHRVFSILNLRDSVFDPSLREFEVRDAGIRVLEPIQSAQGLLTGQARPVGAAPATPPVTEGA
jgi:circadian clock protein KaiC